MIIKKPKKFNGIFYVGSLILTAPIIMVFVVFLVGRCSDRIGQKTNQKKDSVKVITKTVVVHDTVKIIIEKPKKLKKKVEDTTSKEIINIEKKDSL